MKTTFRTFVLAALLFAFAPPPSAVAQTTTIQLAHGTASPVSTLKPGQPFIDTTDGGATYHYWIGGWGSLTGTNVDIFAALMGGGVSSVNSLSGAVTLAAGTGLAVATSSPTVTYGLAPLSTPPTGTYAYPSSIQVDQYGRTLSVVAGSAPATTLPPNGPASGDLSGSYPGPRVVALYGVPMSGTAPTNGYFLGYNGSVLTYLAPSSTAGGTVTSAGVSAPTDIFTVTGSPITTTGTIALTENTQLANYIWAGPVSGSAATPTFRALVAADIPSLDASKITTGVFGTALLGTGTASSSTYLRGDGTWATVSGGGGGGSGTVTSVSGSGGSTGLTLGGGPITTSGTLTLGGTLAIGGGGTGQTTASAAINALLPSQTGNSGDFLTTNGTTVSWSASGGGGGSLAGDVTGALSSTVVGKLQGYPISASSPITGSVLEWNGSTWGGAGTGGDLSGYLNSVTVTSIRGQPWNAMSPTNGQVPMWYGPGNEWNPTTLTFTGGDLTGTFPSPVVAQIQGTPVSATVPTTANQLLGYDGSTQWKPVTQVFGEVPSGTPNGTLTAFTLAHAPLAGTVRVFAGASATTQYRYANSTFSVSGTTVTFSVAPVTGTIIGVDYNY